MLILSQKNCSNKVESTIKQKPFYCVDTGTFRYEHPRSFPCIVFCIFWLICIVKCYESVTELWINGTKWINEYNINNFQIFLYHDSFQVQKHKQVAPVMKLIGKFYLIDLAGSEDNRKTGNEGIRYFYAEVCLWWIIILNVSREIEWGNYLFSESGKLSMSNSKTIVERI